MAGRHRVASGALWAALAVASFVRNAAAQDFAFNFSNTHGNHMVLQRGVNATVWGFGLLESPITVTVNSSATTPPYTATVGGVVASNGQWRVKLPADMPVGGPYTIVGNSSQTNESVTLSDVMVGDVILCGGQSNMAFGMGSIDNSTAIIAQSLQRPGIRIQSSQYSAQNISQAQVVNTFSINWTVADPSSLPGFSAVCYLSAAAVYDAQGGAVPLGLIDTAVGGTAIQLWVPPELSSTCFAYETLVWERWPWRRSCWFNGMTSPYATGPTDVAMFLWDQGENNVGEDAYYTCAWPEMVQAWRTRFGAPNAPFFFVQLPGYLNQNDTSLAQFRATQAFAGSRAANTGYIVTADLSDAYEGSIHNRDKAAVGARLGNLILCRHYNQTGVPCVGPRLAAADAVTNGASVTVTVSVITDGLGGGLVWVPPNPNGLSNSTACPTNRGVELNSCGWFAIQTSDGAWLNATATLSSDRSAVILSATAAAPGLHVNATSNGFADWPVVNVFNAEGLPLEPWPPTPVTSSIVL